MSSKPISSDCWALFVQSQATILANGDYPQHPIPLKILSQSNYIVCCDGAANTLIDKGITPQLIVGDGDSLSADVKERYANIIQQIDEQETNDLTKSVRILAGKGIRDIAIVGATGKREDHTIGNVSLLVEYMRMGVRATMYTDYAIMIARHGKATLRSFAGQQVSIFNITCQTMQSEGLQYPIFTFNNWWQGTLNESVGEEFTISADGDYIVILNY